MNMNNLALLMVLVVHADQLAAERDENEDVYEPWVGTPQFEHDFIRAQDIAIQLMRSLLSQKIDIRSPLKEAEYTLEDLVLKCTAEYESGESLRRPSKEFRLYALSDYNYK
jgi:hypothetical protein